MHKLNDAYALYRRRDNASHPDAVEPELFRRTYSREPRAKFMGVWDTVGALGLPVGGLLQFINKPWSFHDMTLSSWVDNAYQALAIDEHREPFQPSVWDRSVNAVGQTLEQVWFAGVHSNVGEAIRSCLNAWSSGSCLGCCAQHAGSWIRARLRNSLT